MSIKIEGTVCIVACTSGQIEFWRLRDGNIGNRQSQSRVHAARALAINPVHSTALDVLPGQQVTLLYYRPYLGVLDSSTSVWHPKVPAGEQDLWDYPSSEIVRTPAARITGTRSIEPPGDCTCSFFSSILSGYLAALNLPKSESISVLGAYSQEQPADWSNNTISTISDKTIRSLALMPGYFAIGTQAVTRPLHQLPSSEAVRLSHTTGNPS
ncbi:MAG: hypothetical protein M1812_003845 [Candelaria pacifica]|nr:MAG: hypothetical protein M1812_003845 [Candelaria pacifica]